MQQNQSVSEMATEVLARQAGARAKQTGESLEAALRAVLQTEAGRRLGQVRDGDHRDERADQWQPNLPRERAEERRQEKLEERRRLQEEERSRARKAAWESFMRKERRELKLRKEGQLAELLGEALAGEPPAALLRLAREDQRQAEEGLVALTSNGKTYYKLVEELTEEDMGARIAAARLREAWLKERRDGWLEYGGGSQGEGGV
jgi:CHAD domain-containing protein